MRLQVFVKAQGSTSPRPAQEAGYVLVEGLAPNHKLVIATRPSPVSRALDASVITPTEIPQKPVLFDPDVVFKAPNGR